MVSATALIVPQVGEPFQLTKVTLDELRPDEVLVELKATGICHTDLAVQNGKIPMRFPAILGHEGAGILRAVGASVTDLVEGDHVILSYNYCGACRSCIRRQTYHCAEMLLRNFGGQRPDGSQTVITETGTMSTCFFGQSSFCNPAIVRAVCCVRVNKDLPLSSVCALGCGFQTGSGSIFNVVKPVERKTRYLAIFGIGGVGCAAIMAAHHISAETSGVLDVIVAVDLNENRLRLAKDLGATHVINSGKEDLSRRIAVITNGEGLDAAVDCSGAISVVNSMMKLIGAGGLAVTIGGPSPGTAASVEVFDFLISCKTYCGSHQGNSYSKDFIPFLADLYAKGKLPLEKTLKMYKAAEVNVATEEMLRGLVVKPILIWDST
ncbi:Aryl-alcohol dehydrogenase [Talaromyces pinophilus]|nr:Aryl-alcohol dehydrogenase [Talaromyces pinophilus]